MAARVSRAALSEKERVIYDVYYDSKTGFQSMPATYKAAHEKDVSITREDVKTFLKKQAVVQDQSQKGTQYNSFVAHEAREARGVAARGHGSTRRGRRLLLLLLLLFLLLLLLRSV